MRCARKRRSVSPAATWPKAWAAEVREASPRWFGQARRRRAIRLDVLAVALLLATSAWRYGPAWPWLAAALYARGLLLSLLDNMPHYGTDGHDALEIPAFRIPRSLAAPVLHHNLHRTHHLRPDLPWTALPLALAESRAPFDADYVTALLRQLHGPSRTSSPAIGPALERTSA
jgi:fatty acid desaturase